jgi:protein gp37
MSIESTIEWTDATWNPVRGCTKISPGCKHCYAETFAERFRGVKGHPYEQGFDLRLVPEKLAEPLRWRAPKMIFVNSMSDLFHDEVPENYIVAVAQVMAAAKWHTYQVLTKRSDRLRRLLNTKLRFAAEQQHIWWGVSVEDKKYGLPRIEDLRNANASVRFLSVEPLLEDMGRLDLRGIDWMIVGGESGAGARPMKKEWVLQLRDQCKRSGVPFFFKQWGGVRKAKAGRRLEGKTYDEFPKRVRHPMMSAEHCVSAARNIEALFYSGNVFPLSALKTQARSVLACGASLTS